MKEALSHTWWLINPWLWGGQLKHFTFNQFLPTCGLDNVGVSPHSVRHALSHTCALVYWQSVQVILGLFLNNKTTLLNFHNFASVKYACGKFVFSSDRCKKRPIIQYSTFLQNFTIAERRWENKYYILGSGKHGKMKSSLSDSLYKQLFHLKRGQRDSPHCWSCASPNSPRDTIFAWIKITLNY